VSYAISDVPFRREANPATAELVGDSKRTAAYFLRRRDPRRPDEQRRDVESCEGVSTVHEREEEYGRPRAYVEPHCRRI
jgi:hypothetical protein